MTVKLGTELMWFKSSYSTDDGPACVEIAATPDAIHVRDSKHIPGPHLTASPRQWKAFVSHASAH
ncbi:DUF397 domain-containing protein [Streptomyces sp. NPDC052013]|uniref:DUF397 domain-containing protein n=1 Tax=Streptomyces sp. NPDC052013 TaxID=3365679 RepID=UPI0037D89F1C